MPTYNHIIMFKLSSLILPIFWWQIYCCGARKSYFIQVVSRTLLRKVSSLTKLLYQATFNIFNFSWLFIAPKINYIPFREVVFLLIIPDILMLFWIIPYEQYDYLPGLIGLRDTMYIYTFLVCMVKFQNPIWNQTTSNLIGFPFMAANILGYDWWILLLMYRYTGEILMCQSKYYSGRATFFPSIIPIGQHHQLSSLSFWR